LCFLLCLSLSSLFCLKNYIHAKYSAGRSLKCDRNQWWRWCLVHTNRTNTNKQNDRVTGRGNPIYNVSWNSPTTSTTWQSPGLGNSEYRNSVINRTAWISNVNGYFRIHHYNFRYFSLKFHNFSFDILICLQSERK